MVSIVVPCYNAEKFVHRAIESVLNQSFSDWELILVNNNSTDNTRDVLDKYREKYPQKIRVYDEMKKGGCAARNRGLSASSGEWIQFLDADDVILPEKLTRQMNHPDLERTDLVIGNFARVMNLKGFSFKVQKKPGSSSVWKSLITARLGITSANLFKRQSVLNVSGWDEALSSSQEYDLMFRLLKNGAQLLFDLSEISALIYYEGNSITRSANQQRNVESANNYIGLRLRIKDYLLSVGLFNKELESTIDDSLFSYLMDKKILIPQYVEEKMRDLDLQIPTKRKLKIQLKFISKKIIHSLAN